MGVNELHNQIDNLQDNKLTNDTWRDKDTPIEDLANRAIDNFQTEISELPEVDQEEAMQRLVNFLNDLGGELTDVTELLDVLGPQDTVQNFSLEDGRLALGANGYDLSKTIMQDILSNPEFLIGMSKDKIINNLWSDMKYSHESKGWDMVDDDFQNNLNKETEKIYNKLVNEYGFTNEEIDNYMLFGPKLLADLTNPDILKFYGNEDNKNDILQSLDTQEEKLYFLQLWDFVNTPDNERKELLRNDGVFATTLKKGGISDFMKYLGYLDIPNFSESPEVNEKKTEIFDMISEKCDGEELEQVVAIYQVYLEYAGESSNDIDSYLTKIGLFQEMLKDEFDGGWSISGFIERCSRFLPQSVRGMVGFLRRIKQGVVTANPLETAIFAASFCPYAGDVLDMAYGGYKYINGENFSGEEISSSDAAIQAGFGCVGLGLNCLFPGSGSVVKTIKGFAKTTPEFQIITKISKKLTQYFPDIVKMLSDSSKGVLEIIKDIKVLFMEKILPVFKNDFDELYRAIKLKLA